MGGRGVRVMDRIRGMRDGRGRIREGEIERGEGKRKGGEGE